MARQEVDEAPTGEEKGMQLASNQFGMEMMKKMVSRERNFLFSPVSAYAVLAMTPVIFVDKTREQIVEALHIDHKTSNEDLSKRLRQFIDSEASDCTEMYSKVWWNETYSIPSDVSILERFAGISIERSSFPEPAQERINDAIERSTHGRLKNVIDGLNEDKVVVLVNAAYFLGKWKTPFNSAGQQTWCNPDGSTVLVDFMRIETMTIHYLRTTKYQYASIPYEHDYSMIVCLPRNRRANPLDIDSGEFLRDVTTLSTTMVEVEMEVELPKFSFETESMDLTEPMRSIGVDLAFDRGTDCLTSGFHIDAFVQKAKIFVNEVKTEAAVTTTIEVDLHGKPLTGYFRADHPFVYAIRHNTTGSLVFIGYVSKPEFSDCDTIPEQHWLSSPGQVAARDRVDGDHRRAQHTHSDRCLVA